MEDVVASRTQRKRKAEQRRVHAEGWDRPIGGEPPPPVEDRAKLYLVPPVPAAPEQMISVRRQRVGSKLAVASFAFEVFALAIFGIAWRVLDQPHFGTVLASGSADIGLLLFVAGGIVTDQFHVINDSAQTLSLFMVASAIPVGFGLGVVTHGWVPGVVAGGTLLVVGLAWGALIYSMEAGPDEEPSDD